jgi:methylenetetrahydrofolate dehydrogenase (NADP+) / methenyltetrahydrofolate cyclohydrolase
VIIELGKTRTKKGTQLLAGNIAETQVLDYVKAKYNLKEFIVQIYLVETGSFTSRSEASYTSLLKKKRVFETLGIQSSIHIHPYETGFGKLERQFFEANKNAQIAGIIIQMPLPKHLLNITNKIDLVKDIDALNISNNIWERCATAEAVLRILRAKGSQLGRIAVIGANGFVGQQVKKSIEENNLSELIPIDFNDTLETLTNCPTIISAVGHPNLIQAKYLSIDAHLGIDIGNTKSNRLVKGDFDFDDVDGKIKYLTPVPGGMGPLEMVILAERIVRNAIDTTFHTEFAIM